MASERLDLNGIRERYEAAARDRAIDDLVEAVALAERVAEGAIRAVTQGDLRSGSPAAAVVSVMADGVDGLDESALHDEAVMVALGDLASACETAMTIWAEEGQR